MIIYIVQGPPHNFQIGDLVIAKRDFKTNSKDKKDVKWGEVLKIANIDDVGDMSFNNGTWDKSEWLFKKNFINVKPMVAIILCFDAFTFLVLRAKNELEKIDA